MLNVHHAEPDDDYAGRVAEAILAQAADADDYTWSQGEIPGLLPAEVRDPVDVLRVENEQLRTRLHDLRLAFAQRRALDNRIESILSEGA